MMYKRIEFDNIVNTVKKGEEEEAYVTACTSFSPGVDSADDKNPFAAA